MTRRRITLFAASAIIVLAVMAGGAKALRAIYVPPIIMYHSINYTDDRSNKLVVSPEKFAEQMYFLARRGYNVVPLRIMAKLIRDAEEVPYKTLSITFDDGFEDNYRYAYPVLKNIGIPATIFVITDFIGKDGYLSWEQVREMSESGIISIESHTRTQPWLTSLEEKALDEEVVGSKKILEERLKKDVHILSYPMGNYNDTVRDAVRRAGYEAAVATNPGKNSSFSDIFALKRQRISNSSNSMFVFWVESSGYYTFIKEHRDD
ncbi:MAG: polysaccharide deacetylase family protein [Candidatus Omnitrophota bacterium]